MHANMDEYMHDCMLRSKEKIDEATDSIYLAVRLCDFSLCTARQHIFNSILFGYQLPPKKFLKKAATMSPNLCFCLICSCMHRLHAICTLLAGMVRIDIFSKFSIMEGYVNKANILGLN